MMRIPPGGAAEGTIASEVLTQRQVARLFHRTSRTIRSWERLGLLQRVPGLGRRVFYRRKDIERLIAGEDA